MAIDSLLSARISKNAPSRYAAALLATLVAWLARWALNPFLGDHGLIPHPFSSGSFLRLVLRYRAVNGVNLGRCFSSRWSNVLVHHVSADLKGSHLGRFEMSQVAGRCSGDALIR